ncbi:MAG: methyltransferase domain-containing protein [Ruminococcaceae bacterium]|nr:methyltransferase domain-containing protein [Oscillospiraceae bacterium]
MNSNKYSSLVKEIFKQINLPHNAVVADLGCRDAGFLLKLQQAFPDKIKYAVGVDINDKGFKNIKYKKPVRLEVMNCSKKLEFDDNTFDFVFTKDMFECVTDKDFLVSEIHRILKPGGVVICVNCDWDSIAYNGEDKELISKAIHAYAVTKQPWMADLDSWIGRRMYGIFKMSKLFESSVSIHNVVETEYIEGTFGYELSRDIAWLHKENTGALSKKEYGKFISELETAYRNGSYIFSKPYYIYKGIK